LGPLLAAACDIAPENLLYSMRKILFLLTFIITGAACAQEPAVVPGEVIFQLKPGVDPAQVEKAVHELTGILPDFTVDQCISEPMRAWLGTFDPGHLSVPEAIRLLKTIPGVSVAQANHIISTRETVPNDPFFGNQWFHRQNSDRDIDSDLAWDITTGGQTPLGDDIVVCVIEPNGAKWDQTDILPNHWVNTQEIPGNGIDDDGNGYVDDYNGWNITNGSGNLSTGSHGTQVSSMIGARGNNGIGISGVNWNVKIMQVQLGSITEANVIAAYTYPLKMRKLYNQTGGARGAYIVATNASWGVDYGQPSNAPLWCAMYDSLGTYGVISCGATANNNVNVDNVGDLPTACPSEFLISVTATNSSDNRTFSGYGQTTIDLGAPGSSVFLASNSSYGNVSGTSFASPCVAGAVALMYSAPCNSLATIAQFSPSLAAQMVKSYILGGVDAVANLTTETVTGGRLNLRNSLDLLLNACDNSLCISPSALSTQPGSTENAVQISWTALPDATTFSLRYRAEGTGAWTVVNNLYSSTTTVGGLDVCTSYEAQVRANCTFNESDWSTPFFFTSAGCCEAPVAAVQLAESGTTLTVSWEAVPVAAYYDLHLDGAGIAIDVESFTGYSYTFEDVIPCSSYLVAVTAKCPLTGNGESIEIEANTGGCESCSERSYCEATGGAHNEWIAQVVIHDLVNTTVSNGGYAYFGELSTLLTAGDTYPVACTPGYAGFNYSQYFRVWADWNANGVFETNELIFDPGTSSTQQVSGNFTVPGWVTPGHIRIRVAMSYMGTFGGGSLPVNCGTIQYGEVEDYCIVVQSAVGVETEKAIQELRIFPNPAREIVSVSVPADGMLRLYDATGRLIRSAFVRKDTVSRIENLASGVYVVTLTSTHQHILTTRLIVQ